MKASSADGTSQNGPEMPVTRNAVALAYHASSAAADGGSAAPSQTMSPTQTWRTVASPWSMTISCVTGPLYAPFA